MFIFCVFCFCVDSAGGGGNVKKGEVRLLYIREVGDFRLGDG